MAKNAGKPNEHDSDIAKGAVESEEPKQGDPRGATNTSMSGQLSHRDQDERIKGNDTDFPEPGENEEHSGEKHTGSPQVSSRKGTTSAEQKTNQNQEKEDPLAS